MNELLNNPVVLAALSHLDPYGDQMYVIGSSNDFICFSFTHVFNPASRGIGEDFYVIKATLNSETGNFIQEFGAWAFEDGDSPLNNVLEIVAQAQDWCGDNGVRHNKSGWNQDPYFLVREIVMHWRAAVGEFISLSSRQYRHGGKRINRLIGLTQELQCVYSELRG